MTRRNLLALAGTQLCAARGFVAVDPRIELVSIVQLLAGYEHLTRVESKYRAAVIAHFERFRTHRAVEMFGAMSRDHYRFDAIPKTVLAHSPPPELKASGQAEPSAVRRAGGQKKLDAFIDALREFAAVSEFLKFFDGQRETYDAVSSALSADAIVALKKLKDYTGLGFDDCTLIPGMLAHNGGFFASIEGAGVYAIIGPFGAVNGVPVFTRGGSAAWIVQHEFCHSFVNPFVYANAKEFEKAERLFPPIREAMRKENYANWLTAVHEHIVRAITGRIRGDAAIRGDEERGFRYIRAIAGKLAHYETQRDRYPRIVDFLPELIGVFRQWTAPKEL